MASCSAGLAEESAGVWQGSGVKCAGGARGGEGAMGERGRGVTSRSLSNPCPEVVRVRDIGRTPPSEIRPRAEGVAFCHLPD